MVKGRKWILKAHFQGCPKESDFELVEEVLPPLEDGEILFKSEFIAVDPYQRLFSSHLEPPTTMIGSQVAQVLESRDPQFPVGSRIVLYAGWIETGITNPSKSGENMFGLNRVVLAPPISEEIPPSILLGVCGMPGVTAYFGLLERCCPKAGETVLVNSAAGAVGNVVGQIAKIKGCKVIGVAGSQSKLDWLRNDLGFDHVINYKEVVISCPGGFYLVLMAVIVFRDRFISNWPRLLRKVLIVSLIMLEAKTLPQFCAT